MASWSLATQWFGSFLYEDEELADAELFPHRAEAIADRLGEIQQGKILEEERRLLAEPTTVRVGHERLLAHEGAQLGEVPRAREDPAEHDIDPALLQQAAIAHAERRIEEELAEETRHLEQAVAYLDESHDIENRLAERLVAWMRLHAPDLVERIGDPRQLASLVAQHGDREAIAEAQDRTPGMGSPLDPHELRALQGLASTILQQAESREPLETYVQELAREHAPNVSQLTSPAIAARLIRHAGGLDELGKLPASTIQMLGAEGAVFRHLVDDAPPPKHGVIYRHPMVHESHPKDRGSISRAMAAKIAIAARADAFTGNDIAGQLQADLRARVDEIQRAGRRRAKRAREARR